MQSSTAITGRIERIYKSVESVLTFLGESGDYDRLAGDPDVCDFAFGNPHNLPLPEIVTAFQRRVEPRSADWFAYKRSEPNARHVVARTLHRLYNAPFEAEHIHMTNGAFGALAAVLTAIVDPGDEVVYISPPWFFYEPMILNVGGRPVRVKIDAHTFDLDLDAIAAALTPKTRAIIINTPNNPTGKIYPPETLRRLADLLSEKSRQLGRPIYLLSDEAYSRIIYDGREFHSPTRFYPNSFLIYTYGKTLLMPGQRIGYVALPPEMPDRDAVSQALDLSQMITGWAFPNALLQHALADIEELSIDIPHLQQKRDRMYNALCDMGYTLHLPEGTFYLLVQSPNVDDQAFSRRLAEHKVLVLPGAIVEMPGYFRISLTANDEMIERSLPAFAAALD